MEDLIQTAPSPIGQYATFWPRFAARMVDLAIISVLGGIMVAGLAYMVADRRVAPVAMAAVPVIAPVLVFVFLTIFTARMGQTPGKRFMGLQVLRTDGGPPDFRAVLTRCALDALGCAVMMPLWLVGCLWVAGERRSRALHDLAAGTVVRHVRPLPASWAILAAMVLAMAAPNIVVNTGSLVLRGRMNVSNMAPTIREGERWIANGQMYRRHSPRIGDVVVFHANELGLAVSGQPVGRIVGLPGDHIAFRNRRVVPVTCHDDGTWDADVTHVPQGYVAVLGDSRASDTSAGYRMPPFPPPPPAPFGFKGPNPYARWRPVILTVRASDIKGQVQLAGRVIPLWGTRVVR